VFYFFTTNTPSPPPPPPPPRLPIQPPPRPTPLPLPRPLSPKPRFVIAGGVSQAYKAFLERSVTVTHPLGAALGAFGDIVHVMLRAMLVGRPTACNRTASVTAGTVACGILWLLLGVESRRSTAVAVVVAVVVVISAGVVVQANAQPTYNADVQCRSRERTSNTLLISGCVPCHFTPPVRFQGVWRSQRRWLSWQRFCKSQRVPTLPPLARVLLLLSWRCFSCAGAGPGAGGGVGA
jgi:hypothetical protein